MKSGKYFFLRIVIRITTQVFFLMLLFVLPAGLRAETMIYTTRAPESSTDTRFSFNNELLKLALEKTKSEYGDYSIAFAPPMNSARALAELKKNTYPNFVLLTTFHNSFIDDGLDYTRIPVDMGVTGYRICFVSPEAKTAVANVKTLDELKKFSIGQGAGWIDSEILRYNNFAEVVDVALFESLFRMVAVSRVDLFCRGINELEPELKAHPDLKDLDYDRTFAISYPLPRFGIFNKKNCKALDRMTKGLLLAYQDGSFQKLWTTHYDKALAFADLKHRKIFYLKTPNIDLIDFDYQMYYFDPTK